MQEQIDLHAGRRKETKSLKKIPGIYVNGYFHVFYVGCELFLSMRRSKFFVTIIVVIRVVFINLALVIVHCWRSHVVSIVVLFSI